MERGHRRSPTMDFNIGVWVNQDSRKKMSLTTLMPCSHLASIGVLAVISVFAVSSAMGQTDPSCYLKAHPVVEQTSRLAYPNCGCPIP